MSHLVIVSTTNEKSFFPCEDIDAAVATIERFRNEENVESCELFELNPISFEFKPYYHVALSTGGSASMVAATSTGSETGVSGFGAQEVAPPDASPELNVPVLAAVESPNPFDTAAEPAAPAAETPFATSFDVADDAPLDLDTTLANAGVPSAAPIPPLPEAIPPAPPAPAFGQAATAPVATDPFAQTAPVAGDAPSGFGFELDPSAQPAAGFDLAEETPEVADLFGSGAELPPPPPPPVAEVVEEAAPKRGLFGR